MLDERNCLDERLNQGRVVVFFMPEMKDDDKDIDNLSDIYSVLKQDAKAIIYDLKGGVVMWREAAAGAAASAGFILILILTAFRFYPPGNSLGGWAYILGSAAVCVIMAAISAVGFRRYFQLRKKYAPLFERAKKL
jgi:hypothetical protein